MVGGKVVEISEQGERIWLNVQDQTYKKDFCAIYVEKNEEAKKIQVGDQVWWQGKWVMWTPASVRNSRPVDGGKPHKSGVDYDIQIPRASFSGVDEPDGYSIFDSEIITQEGGR